MEQRSEPKYKKLQKIVRLVENPLHEMMERIVETVEITINEEKDDGIPEIIKEITRDKKCRWMTLIRKKNRHSLKDK